MTPSEKRKLKQEKRKITMVIEKYEEQKIGRSQSVREGMVKSQNLYRTKLEIICRRLGDSFCMVPFT